jgi:hypothetical protein
MSSLYSFIENLMKYTGGAIVVAGLFVVPFLLGPMMPITGPFPLTPLIPLVLELVIVNCLILGGVALVIHAEKIRTFSSG